jgi:eukaryotic-like serine/threonine-protein kinase
MTEESLFHEALAKPAAVRAAFLDAACVDQPELRAAIEALLAAHEASGSLLDRPVPDLRRGATGEYSPPPDEALAHPVATPEHCPIVGPGIVIAGRYTLIEKIGEGGMGEVWVAKQTEPVKRKVALKLIKTGMDSRAVLQRFEQERQALALMDHPNIARVFDGGMTPAGQPFFVMELVNGLPLLKFCDEAKLTPKERLELFVPICQAVQHAHQKGIVHRDLKPANILVTIIDGKPLPKVIDFGVAKAMAGKLTDESLSTQFGAVIGTLEYMAPEQAGYSGEDIDTRADIYSLGVILYELLTGLRPFDAKRLRNAAFTEMIRILREEEPSKPSTRLSTEESLPSLAALRQIEPKKLMALLRGDLDWVVMKCLEKRRDRRYETANALGREVQCYLAGEVVEARPPSAWYRLGKFLRRNKGPVLTTCLVGLLLLGGIVGTTYGLIRAESRRVEAEQAQAKEADQRTKAEKARDRTRQALDAMTSSVTGDSLTTQKEISAEQKKFLTEVLTYYQEFAGERADDTPARARTAAAAYRVGTIEFRLGRKAEAAVAFALARDSDETLAAAYPAVPLYRQRVAGSHHNLGLLLAALGQRPEAEQQYRQALTIQEQLAADFPTVPRCRQDLASSHHNLGILLKDLGKRLEAEQEVRTALTIREQLAADFPTVPAYRQDLGSSHNDLGNLLAALRKRPEAEQQYRNALVVQEQLAADFPTVPGYRQYLAHSHNNLGGLLRDFGMRPEAEQQFRQALVIQKQLAADFPTVPAYRQNLASSHLNLGNLQKGLGKRPEAELLLRQALTIQETLAADFPTIPEYRQELALSYSNLGNFQRVLGKQPEAEQQHRKALAIREHLAADFPNVPAYRQEQAHSHNNLGILFKDLGKRPEAEQEFRTALAIQGKLAADFPNVPAYRQDLGSSHHNLGLLLAGLGKRPEAEYQYRQALTIKERLAADFPTVPEYRQGLATSHMNLGNLLKNLGNRPEAEQQYRAGLAIQEQLAADFPAMEDYQVTLAGSYCNLGNLVREGAQPGESLPWYDKAIRTLLPICEKDRRLILAKEFLRNSHMGRARAYHDQHKYAEAVKDWDKAVELSPLQEQPKYRAARATARIQAGQVAEAVAEVAELTTTPNWNAGQWYTFACVYAVASGKSVDKNQEYAKRAMELLEKAVQAGYKDAGHMAKDTDLDSLRGRDDFKKLLADLDKKAPAKAEKQP